MDQRVNDIIEKYQLHINMDRASEAIKDLHMSLYPDQYVTNHVQNDNPSNDDTQIQENGSTITVKDDYGNGTHSFSFRIGYDISEDSKPRSDEERNDKKCKNEQCSECYNDEEYDEEEGSYCTDSTCCYEEIDYSNVRPDDLVPIDFIPYGRSNQESEDTTSIHDDEDVNVNQQDTTLKDDQSVDDQSSSDSTEDEEGPPDEESLCLAQFYYFLWQNNGDPIQGMLCENFEFASITTDVETFHTIVQQLVHLHSQGHRKGDEILDRWITMFVDLTQSEIGYETRDMLSPKLQAILPDLGIMIAKYKSSYGYHIIKDDTVTTIFAIQLYDNHVMIK